MAVKKSEAVVRDIKLRTRRKYSAEEKITIVLEGLRGEESISAICRREGIAPNLYYRRNKDFLEAGRKRLMGDTLPHLIIFESIKNKRFMNPHVRVIRKKKLQKIASKYGLTIEDYLYINALPPFSSRHLLWPTVYSLITACGRSFHPNSTQQQ